MCHPPPHNFVLFELDFDVKFPLLRLFLFLSDLKSTIAFCVHHYHFVHCIFFCKSVIWNCLHPEEKGFCWYYLLAKLPEILIIVVKKLYKMQIAKIEWYSCFWITYMNDRKNLLIILLIGSLFCQPSYHDYPNSCMRPHMYT